MMCRLFTPPLVLLVALSAHLGGVRVAAGKSEDEQYAWTDDDSIYSASAINLDGPDWDEKSLVPVQCIRMNGAEMMVFTLFDNDVKEYDVAPTYDDDANDDYNSNNNNDNYNSNANGCGGDDDAAVVCDDAYYNNDYYSNAANGGDDDAANANNNNDDAYAATDDAAAAATDDHYYDVYYDDDAAAAAAADDDANANDDANDDASDDAYANDDGNNYNNNNYYNNNNNRKLTGFSYNKDARCRTQRGTFYAPLPDFVRAYTRQRDVNAMYMGNRNQVPAAVQYLTCTKYSPSYDQDRERIRRSLYGELELGAEAEVEVGSKGAAAYMYENGEELTDPMDPRRSLNNDNNNDNNDGNDYVDYTRGKDVYIQVGCLPATGKALTFHTYKDAECKKPLDRYGDNSDSRAILSSIGASNVNVHFGSCHHCVVWPERQDGDDDDASHRSREFVADDDAFWNGHGHDSPMCQSADAVRHRCGVKCRVAMAERYNGYGHYTRGLTTTGKVVAFVLAASVAVAIALIDRERKGVSTDKDPLRRLLGGLRIGTPALWAVAGALGLLSVLLELMELKYAFWTVLVSACAVFWAYWYSLYRVGPRKGLLDGQMWLANNDTGVLA